MHYKKQPRRDAGVARRTNTNVMCSPHRGTLWRRTDIRLLF
jgi:hypothetical protein